MELIRLYNKGQNVLFDGISKKHDLVDQWNMYNTIRSISKNRKTFDRILIKKIKSIKTVGIIGKENIRRDNNAFF